MSPEMLALACDEEEAEDEEEREWNAALIEGLAKSSRYQLSDEKKFGAPLRDDRDKDKDKDKDKVW